MRSEDFTWPRSKDLDARLQNAAEFSQDLVQTRVRTETPFVRMSEALSELLVGFFVA